MKYSQGPPLRWEELAGDWTVRFRLRREVELGDVLLLLATDSPGWAAIPKHQLPLLRELDGLTVAILADRPADVGLRQIVERLYKAGLVR